MPGEVCRLQRRGCHGLGFAKALREIVLAVPAYFLLSLLDMRVLSLHPAPPSQCVLLAPDPNVAPQAHALLLYACSTLHKPQIIRLAHVPGGHPSLPFSWQMSQGKAFPQHGNRSHRVDRL